MGVRSWLVVGVLGLMVAATLALRARVGWSATEREILQISCDRRSAEHCTDLGMDLMEGLYGPADTKRGLSALDRGCALRSGRGCFLFGTSALQLKMPTAVALDGFHRGCQLKYFDACAYAGWLKQHGPPEQRDLAAGTTHLTNACGNGSALGCTWLGEMALDGFPTAREREASARSFERGCELGNDWGCLRRAQALGCGRGGDAEPEEALELVTPLCARGMDEACEQRLIFERRDAGVTVENPALERAVLRAAFEAGAADDREAARRRAAALDGGVGTLARAALAITFDELDDAEALLRQLPSDGAQPEIEVARQTLALRREGRPWPEAAWIGWARAGRPDLHQATWLPAVRESADRGQCQPSPPPGPITSRSDFIRAATSTPSRSRLDAPFDPSVAKAALKFSTDPDLPTQLLALTVLARMAKDDADQGAAREFEASARQAFVARRHDSLFFSLLRTPSDLRTAAASEADVVALEQSLELPRTLPRREIYESFVAVLGTNLRAKELAFSATVLVMVDLFDVLGIPGWLERGGHPAGRRARILRRLGEALAGSGWLVDAYYGLRLQQISNRLAEDPALTDQIAKLEARLKEVRTGPRGVQALGEWPWPRQAADHVEILIDQELPELERLKALSETSE